MKQLLCCLSAALMVLMVATVVFGQDERPLGTFNLALRGNYLKFDDDLLKTLDLDEGYLAAIEWYGRVVSGLYLGGDVGYGLTDSNLVASDEVEFIPVGLNAKYVFNLASFLKWDIGGGVSYNYVDVKGFGPLIKADDWIWGGQVFSNLNFRFGRFFLGADARYQNTQKLLKTGVRFKNYQIGAHFGFIF
jgi:hypothetical protein